MKESSSRYLVFALGYAFILGSSWLALWSMNLPINLWMLVIVIAGVLASIGITIYKHRAGHFDKK